MNRRTPNRAANENRVSLVHLEPGISCEIELSLRGTTMRTTPHSRTWSEHFPSAKTWPRLSNRRPGGRSLGVQRDSVLPIAGPLALIRIAATATEG